VGWNSEVKVDILMATYNGEAYLAQQISSITDQDYSNWKLIIRDDGSSDATIDIITSYMNSYPDKIVLITDEDHLGARGSFSRLLTLSRSEYVMFCDQDDIWLSHKIRVTLEKMLELEKDRPGRPLMVHSDLIVVGRNEEAIAPSFWSYQYLDPSQNSLNNLLIQNIVTGCTVMINEGLKNLVVDIPDDVIMHDWWLALIASLSDGVFHINEPTIMYRQHGSNSIGAQRYGIKTYFKKYGTARQTLNKLIVQASSLQQKYIHKFNNEQSRVVKAFVELPETGKIQRLIVLNRYSIHKQGWLRKMAFCLLLLSWKKQKKQ
jgi:glycosyltransferase involved in cell wall biosynthesis